VRSTNLLTGFGRAALGVFDRMPLVENHVVKTVLFVEKFFGASANEAVSRNDNGWVVVGAENKTWER